MFLQTYHLHKAKAGALLKALLLLLIFSSLAACGEVQDPYRSPCNPTQEEKDAQKAVDIKGIKTYFRENNIDTTNIQETASGIHYFVLTPGTGAQVKTGDMVEVHYLGKFVDKPTFDASTTFDSSYGRGTPFPFVVGVGQVIKGWDEALTLMTVGEEARFYIPSGLAYGPCPRQGAIPPNTVLSFDIKVLSAK